MNDHFKSIILQTTGAKSLFKIEEIQSLWSGYGKIVRYGLKDCSRKSIVVKHVQLSDQENHPRGWNTNFSHQRKLKSYQVETAWYDRWNQFCDENCRVPECLALENIDNEVLMVLEDLDGAGFPERRTSISLEEMLACLSWLANFHATFMGKQPKQLWSTGTYWHLETRPDELQQLELDDLALRNIAEKVDDLLSSSPYQTFVHGDAKVANFCFSKQGNKVAAVDFQYVGGGCGMKDVAYFIGSCLDETQCEREESRLLNFYFQTLKSALKSRKNAINCEELERNWRALYPIAWTDFHRFLKGWSPGHWKINGYSERLAREVIAQLNFESFNS